MAVMYQLDTCSTCTRIRKELGDRPGLEIRDIKTQPLTAPELDRLATLVGSYEALFSRRARKYRSEGLADRELTEADYRKYLLGEYTLLKRPVTVVGERVFIGNSAKQVTATQAALNTKADV